ncbi:MAG TPA: hypothetical protein VFN61_07770 [Acidimicrobiales bacterium]|nr:hypothetical protein [Acidimicrobiales bacterium]
MTTKCKHPKLGVDFGGVVHGITRLPEGPDTFLEGSLSQALSTPQMPGAFEALVRLHDAFAGELYIVSKCGARVEDLTLQWLEHHDFYNKTGVDRARVTFVRQRPDKAPRCRELGISHFVDDRADVLLPMRGIVTYRYLFGDQDAHAPDAPQASADPHAGDDYLQPVEDWPDAEEAIMATLG